MKKIFLIASVVFLFGESAFSQVFQGSLKVVIENAEEDEIIGAQVAVYQGEKLITSGVTDPFGLVLISAIDPGTYTVEVISVGFNTKQHIVEIRSNIISTIGVRLEMAERDWNLCDFHCCGREPLFKGSFGELSSFNTDDILKMPVR